MDTNKRCAIRVLVFGASLRQGSLNDKLAAQAARAVAAKGGTADEANMLEFSCPPYDGDVEKDEGIPAQATLLRDRLSAADAVIIASPEYNASMPGVLKNTIDWVSRCKPQPFNGKQALLMSASPSMVGGNRGLWALRVPLEHLGARVYPDMYSLAQAHDAFGADGVLTNATLQKRFESVIECFMDIVEAATHYPAMKKQWVEFLGEKPDAVIDREEENVIAA